MGTTVIGILTLWMIGSIEVAGRATKCPSFQETMEKCMTPVGGGFLNTGGGHELFSDLNTTKKLCQEGKLQDAMSCLEEVYNDCAAETKAKNQLDLMLDVGKWRNGMARLCDNIDYLRQHEECTQNIAVESSHCIQAENKEFQKESSAAVARALHQGRTGQKALMDLGCRFASDVIWCFKEPLDKEKVCPCRYRHLIVDLVVQSMPPVCQIDADYYYYDYGDCLEDDEAAAANVPSEGFSIADSNKIRTFNAPSKEEGGRNLGIYGQPDSRGDSNQGPHIVRRPPLSGTGEETEYSVQEIGQSQGQTGQGSQCPRALAALVVSAPFFVFCVLR